MREADGEYLADAKLARDAVRASTQIAQMGSQWLSCPISSACETIEAASWEKSCPSVRAGTTTARAGTSRRTTTSPPSVRAIRIGHGGCSAGPTARSIRASHFEFRIYKDFSGGITDQWHSHGAGLAHFYLDTFVPDDTISNGGIFAWHDVRENPDTFQAISTFAKPEVLYSYSTTFGNAHGDHTIIRGTRGTLYSPGGEGSPQWWFVPEPRSGWGSNIVFDLHAGKARPEPLLLPGRTEVPPVKQDDNLKAHTDNWLACMRSRKTPNGSIETGFAHSIAVIMATRSYREGRKMHWDRKREEVVEHYEQ